MCKLSVIIPVYNTDKSLRKCLDSIIEQIDDRVEVIVINDGSTDKSKEILLEYENKYKSIVYYEKQNGGVADTRNYGIDHAKGEYFIFVDSDDYIEPGLIKELLQYIENGVDIVKYKAQHLDESFNIIKKIDGPVFLNKSGEEAFNILAFSDILMDSPCLYCFKMSLFQTNNLKFKVNTEHEDFGLIPLVLLLAKKVVSLDVYGYNYIQTEGSITRNNDYKRTIKKFNDTLMHYDNMLQFIKNFNIEKKTEKNVKSYYANAVILKLKTINKENRKEYIEEIKNRKIIKNIKIVGIRQIIKKILLYIDINLYLECIK